MDLLAEMINELSALHEQIGSGQDARCEECSWYDTGDGVIRGEWPCETMEIVIRYKNWED